MHNTSKKQEDLLLEAKNFLNSYKKEIAAGTKAGSRSIKLSFSSLAEHSPFLSESLLIEPEQTIAIMENAIEDSGLVKNPEITLKDLPKSTYIRISEIMTKHGDQLVSLVGKIVDKGKIKHVVVNAKFECQNCGSILSVLQIDKKFREPSRCTCGWRTGFRLINKEMQDCVEVTLQDDSNELLNIVFDNRFLDHEHRDMLNLNNTINVCGVLKPAADDKNTNEINYILAPYGLELAKKGDSKEDDTYKYLKALSSQKGGWFIFEEFVGKLFEKKGYKVNVTRKTGDYGTDVLAVKGDEKIAIQCKLFNEGDKVSNSVVQKALGSLVSPYNANKLIIVTTAKEYTANAINQSQNAKVPVELWDLNRLVAEVKANMNNLDEGWQILNDAEEKRRKKEFNPYETLIAPEPFDIDKITSGITSAKRNRILIVREAITFLEARIGKLIPIEKVREQIGNQVSDEEFPIILESLTREGFVFRPKKDFLQRI